MTESDHILTLAPRDNLEAYAYIFAIEVGLRAKRFIERLSGLAGFQWYKTRLPPDVFMRYKEGRAKRKTRDGLDSFITILCIT